MVSIYEYKKKYDKVAYIVDPTTKNKIYFRSPTVFEFLSYTESFDDIDIKIGCLESCIFAVRNDKNEEIERESFLNEVSERVGFIETIFNNILKLSPLSDTEECKKVYQEWRHKTGRVLNLVKMQFLTVFGDYRLAEDCENFSFKKFMEYVCMLEEVTQKRGMIISELTGDESLMDTETKVALEKAKAEADKAKGNKRKKQQFPNNLNSNPENVQDPSLRTAIQSAQLALQNKMAEDKVLSERGELKKTHDWESENAALKKQGL